MNIYKYALLLIIVSCSSENIGFYSDIKYLDFKNNYNVVGEKIDVSINGIGDIDIKDSIMILSSYRNDKIFNLFSLDNNNLLGSFGTKGKSNNEFISPSQIIEFVGSAGITFSIYDFVRMELKQVDALKSLELNKIIFTDEKLSNKTGSVITSFQIDNENYLISYVNNNDFSLYNAIWNTKSKKNSGDILVLKSDMDKESFLISSVNCISKDKTKYVSAMMFMNQINIFNIQDYKKSFSVSTSHEVSSLDEIADVPMPEKMEYYCGVKSTEDYIYALYINENRKDWALNDIHTKLHIIDWNGNPIACLNLDKKIIAFDVDVRNNIIYGLSSSDFVYKYDISEIINQCK